MTAVQEKRWKAEAEIIKELKEVPSCREMQRLLKDKYGIVANHNTINADLKQDLESLTTEEYEHQKAGILNMITSEIDIAHNIAQTNGDPELQLKAMNTVSKLSKTKSEIIIKFKRAQAQLAKEDKPQINVYIGKPRQIEIDKYKKLDGANNNEKFNKKD